MKRMQFGMFAIIALFLATLVADRSLANGPTPFVIVSDVDDTVKITNVLDRDHASWNAVANETGFAGMPELYTQLLGPDSPPERLRFISGSPSILTHKLNELLNDAHFPVHNLTSRHFGETFKSAYDYKIKHMHALYGSAQEKLILIGDDTESDPEVYATFSSSRPDQVLAVYIRRITGRALPVGSIPFVTAYDIALQEFLARRLTETQAASVGDSVLIADDGTFLPRFQDCPHESRTIQHEIPDSLAQLFERIEHRAVELCHNRTPVHAPTR